VLRGLLLVYPAGMGIAGPGLGTALTRLGMAAWLGGIVVRDAGRRGTTIAPARAGVRAARHAPVPWMLTASALPVLRRTLRLGVGVGAVLAILVAGLAPPAALAVHAWASGGAGPAWPWAIFAGLFMAACAVTTGWPARGTGWTVTGACHPGRAAAL